MSVQDPQTSIMLFSKCLPLAFVAAVVALAPKLQRRDLATIQAAFASVSSANAALDNQLRTFTSDTDPQTAVSSVSQLSGAITSALNDATASVTPTSALSLADSINLVQTSSKLVSAVNETISDLIDKKPLVDAAGADGAVVQSLQQQKTASQTFIAAVVSKVPSSVASLANQQAQQVVTAINRGIAAYGGPATRKLI